MEIAVDVDNRLKKLLLSLKHSEKLEVRNKRDLCKDHLTLHGRFLFITF